MKETCLKLFDEYNKRFFEDKLSNVEVLWSNRMKLSAGVYNPNLDKIILNLNLLSSRSEKEVKETLLVRSN